MTINVATPRKSGWRYYRDTPGSAGSSLELKKQQQISDSQIVENFAFFLRFMQHHDLNERYRSHKICRPPTISVTSNVLISSCSLGWLSAHEHLRHELQTLPKLGEQVRVGNFQQFHLLFWDMCLFSFSIYKCATNRFPNPFRFA